MDTQQNAVENNVAPKRKKIKKPIRRQAPQVPQNFLEEEFYKAPSSYEYNTNRNQEDSNIRQVHVPARSFTGDNYESPQFLENDQNFDYDVSSVPNELVETHKKQRIIIGILAFFCGFLLSYIMSPNKKVTVSGLQGVVVNTEVPQGRVRCGYAERGQGCVLYLMNPQKQELRARDFYDLVAQLTGRQRFVIETGNMRYANTKIRPGELGQFNIPPLTE